MISILCPTRKRPSNIQRLYDSVMHTVDKPEEVELIFYVDEDDVETLDFLADFPVTYFVGRRIVLSKMWNKCADIANGDILMHGGDDIVFRTNGWDTKVRDAFAAYPDRIAFVYGRDGYAPDDFGTHGFIHRNWVNAVGYFVPPYFSSDWNDTWLNEVAKSIGRHVFIPDMFIEHMHPVAGKGEWDITHQERLSRGEKDGVAQQYEKLAKKRALDVAKLRKVMR